MRMKVKFLCLAMMLCLILGLVSAAYAAPPDVSGHWAQAGIEKWVSSGLAKGYPDGTFKPDSNVTRAEFVTLLNRAFSKQSSGANCSFADVKSADWYYADVCAAAQSGYVKGYEDNTFKPGRAISRMEAGAIVSRMLNLPAGDENALGIFSDAAAISDWARGSVAAMVGKNLLSGYPDGSFGPDKSITRAESIAVLDRALGYAAKAVPVTGVKLNVSTLTLRVGATSQLTATVEPENAVNKAVSWQTSDEKIATVDSTGKVSALAEGGASITATTMDGSKTAACELTVTLYSSGGGGGGGGTVPTGSLSVDNATSLNVSGIITLNGTTTGSVATVEAYTTFSATTPVKTAIVNNGAFSMTFYTSAATITLKGMDYSGAALDTRDVNVSDLPTKSGGGTVTGSVSVDKASSLNVGNIITLKGTTTGSVTTVEAYTLSATSPAATATVSGNAFSLTFYTTAPTITIKAKAADNSVLDTKTVDVNSLSTQLPPSTTITVNDAVKRFFLARVSGTVTGNAVTMEMVSGGSTLASVPVTAGSFSFTDVFVGSATGVTLKALAADGTALATKDVSFRL